MGGPWLTFILGGKPDKELVGAFYQGVNGTGIKEVVPGLGGKTQEGAQSGPRLGNPWNGSP